MVEGKNVSCYHSPVSERPSEIAWGLKLEPGNCSRVRKHCVCVHACVSVRVCVCVKPMRLGIPRPNSEHLASS